MTGKGEEWFTEALRDRVGQDEPPLILTAAGVAAVGRRQRMMRAWGASAMAVGVGVSLMVVGLQVIPGEENSAAAGCAPPVPATSVPLPEGSAWPFVDELPQVGPTAGPPDRVGPRPDLKAFECAVRENVLGELPDARFGRIYTGDGTTPAPLQGMAADHALGDRQDTRYGVMAAAVAATRAGHGAILVSAQPVDGDPYPGRCGPGKVCDARTGPHGEPVELFVRQSPANPGAIGYTVYVYTGRTAVVATVTNTPDADVRLPVTAPTPLLTVDQLITLACDPRLALWP
ncbi:hypothetical protein [Hamadaea tsunoensis]|uniref:hypothetical protein n=1 Tax=Hamadaea tsunoensis TaxID=53368 RepID=UPI0004248150|nr:hypothetical protein [Hamadaea tsunoensis]